MKKLLSISLLLLSIFSLKAQNQNNIWSLPPNYYNITGGTSLPLLINPLGYQGQSAVYSHNAMQDKNGNLLFSVIDDKIYDKTGEIIRDIYINEGSELMIVPAVDDCNRYFIFNGLRNVTTSTPMYGIFDFDVNTPLLNSYDEYPFFCDINNAGCPQPNVPLNATNWSSPLWGSDLKFNSFITYAATPLINNTHRFIYVQTRYRIYVFKLTNVLNFVGTIDFNNSFGLGNLIGRSEMEIVKLNNGNFRLAYGYTTAANSVFTSGFFSCDINANTGLKVTGTEIYTDYNDPLAYVHGIEFTQGGEYLYITHNKTATTPSSIDVFQFGVSTQPTPVSVIPAVQADEFQHSFIEIDKNGELYFATHNRLASYNPSTLTWVNTKTPMAYSINDAGFIGDVAKQAYLLPDQIDGMDYAAHITVNTECCLTYATFSTNTYSNIQGGVQTWGATNPFGNSSIITVQDELIIKTGANITANNLTFKFAPDAKLTIEKGAIFTINGCTLTVDTQCELAPMWNGIEVHGPSANQQSADAGRFIANNSIIEHSHLGAHNYKTNKSGTPGVFWEQYGYRGGVIVATNTTFRNNHRGTAFFDYQNGNGIDDESEFYNCTFVTDAPLNKPTLTPTVIMAHLFGVQGVNFQGCDFKFTSTDPSIAAHQRGSGIEAFNCLLTVTSLSTGGIALDRSKFTNVTRGIEAYSNLLKVTNTDFENVWRGAYLKSSNYATILNNTFNVASGNAWGYDSYGLNLDNCDKYRVENNNFNTSNTQNGYLGVHVYNSGVNNNEIYRNTFDNLTVGSQAAQINGDFGENGGTGLEFRCNTYTNTKSADIFVSSNRVRPTHGECINQLTPSNNQFSRTTAVGDFWQASTVTSHVTYQYSTPNGYPVNPIQYNGTVNTFPTMCTNSVFNPTTSCPQKNKKSLLVLKDELVAEKLVVTDLKEDIAQGEAQALYEAIHNLSQGDAKNVLMAASPYLSDDVLVAYLESNPSMGHIQQVFLANSPLSDYVLNKLQQSNLPKGIKGQIVDAQTGATALENIKIEIAYYQNEVTKLQNDIIRHYLFEDDVVNRFKAIIEFIKQESNCIEKKCELIEFYVADKNFVEAEIELLNLALDTANVDLVKLYDNIIQLEQVANVEQELINNTIIQQSVTEVADLPIKKKEKAMAEGLLKRAKLRNNQEDIEGLNMSGSGLRLMNQEGQLNTQQSSLIIHNTISVYPNPTSGELNITHNLSFENGKVTFKVYNMLGTEVLNENLTSTNNELKINNLKSGVYFYTVTQNNQTIKTDKLMVR